MRTRPGALMTSALAPESAQIGIGARTSLGVAPCGRRRGRPPPPLLPNCACSLVAEVLGVVHSWK